MSAPGLDPPRGRRAFSLLLRLFGDSATAEIFSEEQTVASWMRVESALARAQADVGVLSAEDAKTIDRACAAGNVDRLALWEEARNVGYPILPLIRQLAAQLPAGPDGRLHYGATTQDIMDTGLALQLDAACRRLGELLVRFGDAVARLVTEHEHTVVAARTHAQQAVPTTYGAKLAVLLAELARHRRRLAEVRDRVGLVSLYGAGGTSAALGSAAAALRRRLAERLGLGASDVPWHVARDRQADFGTICVQLAATASRFCHEVIDLSRTEIVEVREADGHHRGASSTMPQKVNPVDSEAVVGMAATAEAMVSALHRAMEAGHDRSAGEWQLEWHVLPQLAELAAGAVATAGSVAADLRVYPDAMRHNLDAEGGLVMAEAYMMHLAPELGREQAHDLVYKAAQAARQADRPLFEALRELGNDALVGLERPLRPDDYLGDTSRTCQAGLQEWAESDSTAKEDHS